MTNQSVGSVDVESLLEANSLSNSPLVIINHHVKSSSNIFDEQSQPSTSEPAFQPDPTEEEEAHLVLNLN